MPGFNDASLLKGDGEPDLAKNVTETQRKNACAERAGGMKCSVLVKTKGKQYMLTGVCRNRRCEDLDGSVNVVNA